MTAYTDIRIDVLPREFSTPMFWNQDDLKELEGTDIVCKTLVMYMCLDMLILS